MNNQFQFVERLSMDLSVFSTTVQWNNEDNTVVLISRGSPFDLDTPEALKLLRWLQAREPLLQDRFHNYIDCSECGRTHHKDVKCAVDWGDEGA